MHALANARREKGEVEARALIDCVENMERTDAIAEALGISISAEDWWESTDEEKQQKILGRISIIRGLTVPAQP